jgi:hypothetical protein
MLQKLASGFNILHVPPHPTLNARKHVLTRSSNGAGPQVTELTPKVAELIEAAGIDYSISGLRWLPEEAQVGL